MKTTFNNKQIELIQKIHNKLRTYKFRDKKEEIDYGEYYYGDELANAIVYAYNEGKKRK